MTEALSGTFGFMIMFFLLVAAVLWFLLPFAIFGTKAKMDELIQINKRANVILEAVYEELHAIRKDSLSKKNDNDIPVLNKEEI